MHVVIHIDGSEYVSSATPKQLEAVTDVLSRARRVYDQHGNHNLPRHVVVVNKEAGVPFSSLNLRGDTSVCEKDSPEYKHFLEKGEFPPPEPMMVPGEQLIAMLSGLRGERDEDEKAATATDPAH